MTRVVMFDFDGTVCVGDGVVIAYADALGAACGQATRAFLRTGPDGGGPEDGYGFVARFAESHGVDPEVRAGAYAASRAALHRGEIAAVAPAGLGRLLDDRPAGAVAVLVTNAPRAGLDPLIERLGLDGAFDDVLGDADKPDGLAAVVARLPAAPAHVLSIGDVWRNDLAPVAALGGRTALVDRWGARRGAPDHSARTLPELYPVLRSWWAGCGAAGRKKRAPSRAP